MGGQAGQIRHADTFDFAVRGCEEQIAVFHRRFQANRTNHLLIIPQIAHRADFVARHRIVSQWQVLDRDRHRPPIRGEKVQDVHRIATQQETRRVFCLRRNLRRGVLVGAAQAAAKRERDPRAFIVRQQVGGADCCSRASNDQRAAGIVEAFFDLGQFVGNHLAHRGRISQQPFKISDQGDLFVILGLNFAPFECGKAAQLHVKNRRRLYLSQFEALHQGLAGRI